VATVSIKATAFRRDGRAALVTVTALTYDSCDLRSETAFQIGETLRVHVSGQGWIEAEVKSASEGEASLVFVTECHV
jgi:hypothetical protein